MNNCVEKKFAELSGDTNPLHTDDEFAASTVLGRRVAHGQISGALFSRLIGMYLPGKHSLYLKQTSEFVNPIFPGTKAVVSGVITKKIGSVMTVEIKTALADDVTKLELVRGSALVKLLA